MNISIKTKNYTDNDGIKKCAAYVSCSDITVSCHGKNAMSAKRKLYKKLAKMTKFLPQAREALAINLGYITDISQKDN